MPPPLNAPERGRVIAILADVSIRWTAVAPPATSRLATWPFHVDIAEPMRMIRLR